MVEFSDFTNSHFVVGTPLNTKISTEYGNKITNNTESPPFTDCLAVDGGRVKSLEL